MVDYYHILGYFSGLYFIKPEMDATALLRTAVVIHFLDAVLCRVIAGFRGRDRNLWSVAGFLLGIWALATLFLLPAKIRAKEIPDR